MLLGGAGALPRAVSLAHVNQEPSIHPGERVCSGGGPLSKRTCYQLQRPLEPYLVEKLGAGQPDSDAAASYGWLQSFFAAIQTVRRRAFKPRRRCCSFSVPGKKKKKKKPTLWGAYYKLIEGVTPTCLQVGSPLVGYLLDVVGSRYAFMTVFAASALSYEMLARCTTLNGLFLSKVPTLLQHAFLVAQAVVSQVVPPERRAAALGRLMTAYTIGATVGPALGG